jgi:hypothetical protein
LRKEIAGYSKKASAQRKTAEPRSGEQEYNVSTVQPWQSSVNIKHFGDTTGEAERTYEAHEDFLQAGGGVKILEDGMHVLVASKGNPARGEGGV